MARVTIIGLHYAPERSGNAPYTTSLAEGLSLSGHTVRVITGFPHYPEWRLHAGFSGWRRIETLAGVSVTRLRHYIPRKPTGLRRIAMELTFGIRAVVSGWDKPDVIIFVSPALIATGLASIRARINRRSPFLIWVQDLYSRGLVETGMAAGPVARAALRLEAEIFRSADGIVAIHDRFRAYITDALGVPGQDIHVVRNWTHLPPAPAGGQAEIRSRFGWNVDDIVVLHAGNMGTKQGLDNVVAAARLAEVARSKVRFVLMGDGNQRARLELAAAGLRNISFIDSLPDADFQTALTAADVLLVNELPGVKDMSVPSKLTSYLNAGVPVLAATDFGSVTAEEIECAQCGVRVDADDPAELVAAAEKLGKDKDLSQRLGRNGLEFRRVTLSERAAIAKYDHLVQSVVSSWSL